MRTFDLFVVEIDKPINDTVTTKGGLELYVDNRFKEFENRVNEGPVRIVAANLILGTQLETAEPVHRYTFFSAKTAITFIRLRALIWRYRPDPLGVLAGGRNESHSL